MQVHEDGDQNMHNNFPNMDYNKGAYHTNNTNLKKQT